MKKVIISMVVCILFSGGFLLAASENNDFTFAAKKAKPSVVYISVFSMEENSSKGGYVKTGYGSGTIVSRDGYVITNYHVVNKGDFYIAVMSDGTECELEKVRDDSYYVADEETDLAVLKIKNPDNKSFVPVEIGNSDDLAEGQWVIAIGNPYGLRHSVTCGIVSSTGRSDIGFADIEDFIQTDVPINPGNSGGALVNDKGELIGINAAIRTVSGGYQGISFAIPSKLAVRVYRELLQNGRVRRGWLGIHLKEERRRTDSDQRDLRIISVAKNSPAYDAGIREGDIIRKTDGAVIPSQGKLMKYVKNREIGSSMVFTVARDGKLYDFKIVMREKEIYKDLSRTLSKFYEKYGVELAENESSKVVISRLSPHKLETHHNLLQEGDVFTSINGARVRGLDDLARIFVKWENSVLKATVKRGSRIYVIDFVGGVDR